MRDKKFAIYFLSFFLGFGMALVMNGGEPPMPGPFTRVLQLETPRLHGRDVVILQNLLRRAKGAGKRLHITGVYDEDTATEVRRFQQLQSEQATGILDKETAEIVLDQLMSDNYKDQWTKLPEDVRYKFLIPVHKNRDIETNGTLMDNKGRILHVFRVRAHGALNPDRSPINQLTTNGNTVTGLMTSDLNTKEPWPKLFGPYPVVRCVKGLQGNAAIGRNENDTFISNYRSGILIHTGEWDDWTPDKNMPNSKGCMHVHPNDMKKIVDILINQLGVIANENPFGKLPYPYHPQGLVSIEEIEESAPV